MNGLGRRINAVLVASTLLLSLVPEVARPLTHLVGVRALAAIDDQALAAQVVFDVKPLLGDEPKAEVSRVVSRSALRHDAALSAGNAEAARSIRLSKFRCANSILKALRGRP